MKESLEGIEHPTIDRETFRAIESYFGGDPRVPREVRREALCEYPDSWSLEEFQELIANAITKIPEKARAKALVELEGGYEESTYLKITYMGLETPGEVAANVQRCLAYVDGQNHRDWLEYERLRTKYGA